jgi:hypothetical protein
MQARRARSARACDRMQLAHMLAGFGGMFTPHRQHSTVPGVPAGAYICAFSVAMARGRGGAGRKARARGGGTRREFGDGG